MLRRIKVDQLTPGMYVARLDRSWLSVPAFRHRVSSPEQVELLRRHRVREVVIDTDKGADLPGDDDDGRQAPEAGRRADAPAGVPAAAPGTADPVPYAGEITGANRIYEEALDSVSRMMEAVRRGETPDVALAETAVDEMVASVLRNRDALASLVNLREQSESVFQHCVRVGILSVAFGTRLGFTRQELKALGMGAILHDVGKMRLPPALAERPAPLNPRERKAYRQHPLLGVQVFEGAARIEKQSLLVLLQHHERVDGTGFPQGLAEDEISRMARMVMIVDTYDNLTGRAPPDRRLTPHEAIEWIRRFARPGLDASLVDEFADSLGLYPPGTFVRLSDNRLAIVLSVHHSPTLLPKVWVVFDTNHRVLPRGEIVDLAAQRSPHPTTIVSSLLPEKFGFDLPGYVKAHGLFSPGESVRET